ncbi:MAG: molybdopterin-dependent oxidoreductase [Cyclobacteriaceae bacterium]|nr:molybdopterin-dependent oxidoreductase [Cyclobacteriaceae bacterium]
MKRRGFIITGGIVGGGLLVGVGGLTYMNKRIVKYSGLGMGEGESLNAFVRIAADNTVTLAISKTEMGQGVYTALPMLIAEELEVEMDQIRVVHPQPEGPYANLFMAEEKPRAIDGKLTMMQKVFAFIPNIITGGSTSVRDAYDHLRVVGAMAREMLLAAAAKRWGVSTAQCYADTGFVINRDNQEKFSYGELASEAAQQKAPKNPPLKDRSEFRLVGKAINRLDVPEKVNGSAIFGLDVRPDNLKYGVIKHPSQVGGTITSVDNKSEIEGMPGIAGVVQIEEGVVVVGETTWHARQAADRLKVQEDNPVPVDAIKTLTASLSGEPSKIWEDQGNITTVLDESEQIIEASYEVPYLAHACMEPLNCTVLVDGERAECWTGNQSSTFILNGVSEGAGIAKDNIICHTTYLGGGFGRRGETDFVLKAAKVAKEFPGVPIQLVYTREEDMRNDFYRPAVVANLKAGLGKGEVNGWKKKVATQGALAGLLGRNVPMMPMKNEDDPSSTEGLRNLPYKMTAAYTDLTTMDLPMRVGTWRSVGHSQNAFFAESFMDECAHAINRDPYELRREMLADAPRFRAVLDKLAEISNWSQPLAEGQFRGMALHESFGSIVGEVAEISLHGKNIKLERVYCVIDCGRTVNPGIIETQMQSGIVYGLTAALYGAVHVKEGKIVQNNFPNYQMVKMNTMPEIITHIMEVDEYPGGVGEPGTPPIAPALTNAIFAGSGTRIRSLPLSRHGYKFV